MVGLFFKFHDPTTPNRQGLNVGYQYRSEIFYNTEEEKNIAEKVLEETNKKFHVKTILEKKSVSFNKNLVKFINWFSLYNLVPKGMVLKMCLGDKSVFSENSDSFKKNTLRKKNNFNPQILSVFYEKNRSKKS